MNTTPSAFQRAMTTRLRIIGLLFVCVVAAAAHAQNPSQPTLEKFYVHYRYSTMLYASSEVSRGEVPYSIFNASPPIIDTRWPMGGVPGETYRYPVDSRMVITTRLSSNQIELYMDVLYRACPSEPIVIERQVVANTTRQFVSGWRFVAPNESYLTCQFNFLPPPAPPPRGAWVFNDAVTYGAPLRRKAIDGGQYDASPMSIVRNGQPWVTYHWGYRLGLVATTSDWNSVNLPTVPALAAWPTFPDKQLDFELTTLPPPWVEDDVVEYVNKADFPKQPGGQFFYAVLAADKAALDAVPAWRRSGKSFKSGGYVSACRFYGGKNGGPNTHFYSADDAECTYLKQFPFLEYEGQSFAISLPVPSKTVGASNACPVASKPLYRLYNNAGASNGAFVSNHRYVTDRADVTAAVAQGWLDEGVVMCAPE